MLVAAIPAAPASAAYSCNGIARVDLRTTDMNVRGAGGLGACTSAANLQAEVIFYWQGYLIDDVTTTCSGATTCTALTNWWSKCNAGQLYEAEGYGWARDSVGNLLTTTSKTATRTTC
jgi:hypothetical protein